MNKLSLMTGIDIPVPALELTIHQPTIKEISYLGELDYFQTLQLLCFNKATLIAANPQGASRLSTMSDFQLFMTLVGNADQQETFARQNKICSVLTLFLPGYIVQFLPTGLYFNNAQKKHSFTLNETNFQILKDVLYEVSGINNSTGGQNSNFNPKGEKAARIAAKLMRGRARAAQSSHGDSIEGMLGRYVSILTVGLSSMSLEDCLNLTVYQLYDLIERYGLYTGWDLDIRSRLAGGKPDEKPDDWMKDLH